MGMLLKLLGRDRPDPVPSAAEQAAVICLKLSDDEIGSSQEREAISVLRDRLIRALQQREAGEFDTLEFGEGFGTLSFNGPNADRLAEVILPLLRTYAARSGSYLLRRYGEPGAREQSMVLVASA